jgi:hypothetical protein
MYTHACVHVHEIERETSSSVYVQSRDTCVVNLLTLKFDIL